MTTHAPSLSHSSTHFALRDGEIILFQYGLSGFGRLWTFFALPGLLCSVCYMPLGVLGTWLNPPNGEPPILTTLISGLIALPYLALCLGPWLLSGQYWLTTQRVVWQPRLGRRQQLPLAQINTDQIRAIAWTQSLHLQGESKISLRFVAGLDRLWGGILLLQTPGLAAALEKAATQTVPQTVALGSPATCSTLAGRTGVVVLTPTFVAFLPTQLADYTAEVMVEALLSIFAHAHPRAIHPELPLEAVLNILAALPPEPFALQLQRLTMECGGVYWRNSLATTVERRTWSATNHQTLSFTTNDVSVRFSVPAAQLPHFERVLMAWGVQEY